MKNQCKKINHSDLINFINEFKNKKYLFCDEYYPPGKILEMHFGEELEIKHNFSKNTHRGSHVIRVLGSKFHLTSVKEENNSNISEKPIIKHIQIDENNKIHIETSDNQIIDCIPTVYQDFEYNDISDYEILIYDKIIYVGPENNYYLYEN